MLSQIRSLLFAPADAPRKLAKALLCGADAVIIDLEDSVAGEAKARARAGAAEFLGHARASGVQTRLYVRINPLTSAMWEADLAAVMPARPDAIMLPKSLGGASVQQLGVALAVLEARQGLADGATRILPIATESAAAIFGLASYIGCSKRLEGLSWGAEDLSADIGAQSARLESGAYSPLFALARAMALFAAAAAGVTPVDTVFAAFRDEAGLRADCHSARRDGFGAKLAIHPDQIAIINAAFTPGAEEIAQAQKIIAAFAAAPERGVISLGGQMLDRPHLLRAQLVLAKAAIIGQAAVSP